VAMHRSTRAGGRCDAAHRRIWPSARTGSTPACTPSPFCGSVRGLPQGRWTSIVGPNGAGKSSLLKVLSGLWPAQPAGPGGAAGPAAADWPRRSAPSPGLAGPERGGADDLPCWTWPCWAACRTRAGWLRPAAPTTRPWSALRQTQAWEWRHRPVAELGRRAPARAAGRAWPCRPGAADG
jgi:iron complex transport system ATP-binding protein